MLGWLRKRKYTFTKEDGLKSIGTTKETNIDFKEYFYDESNKYFQLQEVVQENLESYTPEEIERLAADVLYLYCCFVRNISTIKTENMSKSNLHFHLAVIGKLSDATHNIPGSLIAARLGKAHVLNYHLSEFLTFLKILHQTEIIRLDYHYHCLDIRKEWEHLYVSTEETA
ncbi:hypothetical protein LG291_25120 (plasmid) [Cytobacillus firmus]|uniref:Uncharacterized protein n=1 Tax=Cytobacillus firmus DS1 TaxID=1307436 RepID=W7KQI9_CYTFI|nr:MULTISPECIES: hypothetical protein [Bacillaceae]EWG08413.1 hypothetical protein PBF_24268 [Cytobacillus firmus DS1]MBN8203881.1 hypothetical protein [Bacillus sp. NTK034]